ncbi:2-oxoacid:ferredoxin/flavodoxin oxidoreductase subunit family protein [Luminiphilus syltensis NOR5-1B]|uniref:2-oxoacid:ferredoxin/flavodoxin oxidoreductase subunit family protein n=1 Tax=Luminiphilus syltensis NOR5-1B TaxID=565045 RepID=B8KTX2_9GAMM|nr:indolepyruvate ferredoxin oxidoreductase family protein [Luminiphilus syltensis]EED36786.1 2-oxoacid:ferredoxin/flavodoxin oxidoreductase subunit family protein [Luminiphilus syltensis NOR5-1B]
MQAVSLRDRYELEQGLVFLNPMQALVRLVLTQAQVDSRAGLNTAGFVSGYRGSPLGGFDKALWSESQLLTDAHIKFQPGLNEDLAATSVWGSQLTGIDPKRTVDGVFGLWYGKGPGVDRSMDALKHANMAGTSRFGGALAVAGDDHGAFSSSNAHQSDHMLIGASMPVLYPATLEELIDFGIRGWALSRFSGCWVGIKLVSEIAETSRITAVGLDRHQLSPLEYDPACEISWPAPPLMMERSLVEVRLPRVHEFTNANGFDATLWREQRSRLGIVAAGKSWLDVREALSLLGIDEAEARRMGLALYKPGLIWPLNATGLREFALGLNEMMVVEEKRPIIEDQAARLLYGLAGAPQIIGEQDAKGHPLIAVAGDLQALDLAVTLGDWLEGKGTLGDTAQARLTDLKHRREPQDNAIAAPPPRKPFYCAGCPHNTSTRVPEGSHAMAGIGCHGMAAWIPSRSIVSMTHMGGEGMHWLGRAPFTDESHIFQNVGDGTYAHSASLNIRAAVAAGVTMTFKILYNEAVAMTGGQPVEAGLSVGQICELVLAEHVAEVVVVTDDLHRFDGAVLPRAVTLLPREQFDEVQERLREKAGVTVLIYAQGCAAEKRRKRKRQQLEDPAVRVMINDRVCEGCGDCGRKSNCVAIQPLETPLGRKRKINQSACNKDLSCLRGFCPSFVSFEGGEYAPRKTRELEQSWRAELPTPEARALPDVFSLAMAGIGGGGVVSVAAIMGMAAHIEGLGASILDVTGLAQKNGAVYSHIRFSRDPDRLASGRIPEGCADVVLGFDLIAAAGEGAAKTLNANQTETFLNAVFTPSADFIDDGDQDFGEERMRQRINERSRKMAVIDAGGAAERLLGDQIFSNLVLLGAAWQSGTIPLSADALKTAITLNGASVDKSLVAFDLGRLVIADSARFAELDQIEGMAGAPVAETADALIAQRATLLEDYQNRAYADRFRAFMKKVAAADNAFPDRNQALTRRVAEALFKHMAIKDEYEVARLYAETDFMARAQENFSGDARPVFHLAPPLLSKRDPVTGELIKRQFGSWILPAFRVLAKLRPLRETPFDVFGLTEERRWERALRSQLMDDIDAMLPELNPGNYDDVVYYAALSLEIRGFGHVKKANGDRIEPQLRECRDRVLSTIVREYAA